MDREIAPEILDGLHPTDPAAARSRRDLRFINVLMGNNGWMRKQLDRALKRTGGPIWELGAGEGLALAPHVGLGCELVGIDLRPRPAGLPAGIDWREGDLFEVLREGVTGVAAANLFLHHFSHSQLQELGSLLKHCSVLCFSEPWRCHLALWEGRLLLPFVGRVTRHDMMVSIRAGFRKGELPEFLNLGTDWNVREECGLLGAYRLLAWKT